MSVSVVVAFVGVGVVALVAVAMLALHAIARAHAEDDRS